MGRPLKKKFFQNTATSGFQLAVTADLGDGEVAAYITAQKGVNKYICTDGNASRLCTLVSTVSNPGECSIEAFPYQEGQGTRAAFTITMEVDSVTIEEAGSGHSADDILTLVGGTSSTAATITIDTVSDGAAATVSVTEAGTYTVLPTDIVATTSDGSGTGTTFNVQWKIKTVVPSASGSKYTALPVLTTTGGGTGEDLTPVMEIDEATLTAAGTGHAASDVLTVTGGTGTSATITVDAVDSGAITEFTVTTGGDYTALASNPVATSTDGSGSGATFTLNYKVKSITVADGGSDFDNLAKVTSNIPGAGSSAKVKKLTAKQLVTFDNTIYQWQPEGATKTSQADLGLE